MKPEPKAAVVLFAGGHGGLQLAADGSLTWGRVPVLVVHHEQDACAACAFSDVAK